MASDYLLKIDGVKGESGDSKHPEWIELESWSWGETQTGSMSSGSGGGAGKVSMQDFSFTARLSSATPDLMAACASGKHFSKVELVCRKAGEEQNPFLKLELNDVLVSSYQTGGSNGSDPVPIESFSLNFAKIKVEYFKQDAKGKTASAGVATWDLKKNAKV
jgi:type VI secretion system secreted protein Hcp